MSWVEFVKDNYDNVRHLPNHHRLKALSMVYQKRKSTNTKQGKNKIKGGYLMTDAEWKADAIKRGNIQAGQTEAKSFKDLLDVPVQAKAPQLQFDKEATMKQVAQAEKQQAAKQATSKNIWAPYKAPFVLPIPEDYPYFLFQHPNKYSANPNQVMVCDSQARFLKSSIYKKLNKTGNLKYVPAKTSGYGASNPEAKIQPHKDFRILFLFQKPDKDEYVYDAKNVDEYINIMDMCKDSGFIYPVEVLSKQVMARNAQLAQAVSQQSSATADYAWNAGATAVQNSWEQAVSTAANQEEAQTEYFNTLKEQEAARERAASKKSGWDTFLDVAGDVAKVAVKLV